MRNSKQRRWKNESEGKIVNKCFVLSNTCFLHQISDFYTCTWRCRTKLRFLPTFLLFLIENAMFSVWAEWKSERELWERFIFIFSILQRVDAPDHFHTCRIQPNNTEKRLAHMVPRENAPHCTKPHCHQSVALLLTAHVSRRCNARDKKKFESCFVL